MARLRAYRANGGKVYDIMLKKKKETMKENRISSLTKRVVKEELKTSVQEKTDTILILTSEE